MMGRSPGPSKGKIKKILDVLKKHPEGIWCREIARESKISKSTVNRYLNGCLKNDIEIVLTISGLVKLYKLKE